jgi:hypothetical protein
MNEVYGAEARGDAGMLCVGAMIHFRNIETRSKRHTNSPISSLPTSGWDQLFPPPAPGLFRN